LLEHLVKQACQIILVKQGLMDYLVKQGLTDHLGKQGMSSVSCHLVKQGLLLAYSTQ